MSGNNKKSKKESGKSWQRRKMCIRDRSIAFDDLKVGDTVEFSTSGKYKEIGAIYGFPIKVVSETSFESGLPFVDTVSYTHLDVYKRQLQHPV